MSTHALFQPPISDYIQDVLHEDNEDETTAPKVSPNDDWDDGLTFTAKSSRKFACLLKSLICPLIDSFGGPGTEARPDEAVTKCGFIICGESFYYCGSHVSRAD